MDALSSLVNPIPTGHGQGRNQPLYERHVTKSGRNRVKPSRRAAIPNGCFDGYEVKVNKYIFQYQEKVKLISIF